MSMFFCDPFFDDYDSFLTLTPYTKESDLINPASGFGRLDVEETQGVQGASRPAWNEEGGSQDQY